MANEYIYPYLIASLKKGVSSPTLLSAIEHGHVYLIKWIMPRLSRVQSINFNPNACSINSVSVFRFMLQSFPMMFETNRFIKNPEILKFVLTEEIGHQPFDSWFIDCCHYGEIKSIQILLNTDISPEIKGRGLMLSINHRDSLEIVELILQHKIPLYFKNQALLTSIYDRKNWQIVDLLLRSGVDLHMENDRFISAVKSINQSEILDLLSDWGLVIS